VKQVWKLVGSVRDLDRARIDAVVATALALAIELQVWLIGSVHDRLAAAVAGLVLCAAVAFRRRWPLGAVVAGCGAVSVEAAFGGVLVDSVPTTILAGFLCFYGAGAFLPKRRSRVALGVGILALLPQIVLTPHVVSDLFFEPAILAFVPWLIGRWLRERAERARRFRELCEQLDANREQRVAGAADRERIRIARELHDVVGHCLSVIVLQAGGARMVVETEPERAREAMRVVERAGHAALVEMRHLLGVFGSLPRGPQPGLASIGELVERTRAAGLKTDLTVDGEPRDVSPALALCVYRIVQEGLTNTIKHAGRAQATVRMSWDENRLELEVADDGQGPAPDRDGRVGHGLIGILERAALHHGSVEVGAGPAGGYRVFASLPLAGEETG
jgi:signal transduction histidine kinase